MSGSSNGRTPSWSWRRRRAAIGLTLFAPAVLIAACAGPAIQDPLPAAATISIEHSEPSATAEPTTTEPTTTAPSTVPSTTTVPDLANAEPDSRDTTTDQHPASPTAFTIAFAGDVNFAERTADRLAQDPDTVFGAAAPGLAAADLTVVNLETAVTTGGEPEPKSFTFRAPPAAFTALRAAGVDVASMANNHGADFGEAGLLDTVAAIKQSSFPVIGIGADDTQAMAPYRATINGTDLAIFAVSAVHDRTLQAWTATDSSPGIASAFDPRLVDNVRRAAADGSTVVVFLHWGTEYVQCPDGDQEQLADELAGAGAAAVVGTHAHVLQGAGWREDGVYVAYGLSNYLWWRSFGNEQDDNGVLTLTFDDKRVTGAGFVPSHLDDTGVPVPASGAVLDRITAEWEQVRGCTALSDQPPS